MTRLQILIVIVAGSFALTGCASVTGLVVGPVTGPISYFEHEELGPLILGPDNGYIPFLGLVTLPLIGAFRAFANGIIADIGYLRSGEYGGVLSETLNADGEVIRVYRAWPFSCVFDPFRYPRQIDSIGKWQYPES